MEDQILDYQPASLAMAGFFRGISPRETADLTYAMMETGEVIDFQGIVIFAVDKHSTGGVGDKNPLVFEPVVSACGLRSVKCLGVVRVIVAGHSTKSNQYWLSL